VTPPTPYCNDPLSGGLFIETHGENNKEKTRWKT